MLRQTDAQVIKKYSQMKLQMKREALAKLNRKASESDSNSDTEEHDGGLDTVFIRFRVGAGLEIDGGCKDGDSKR
jgi:hypothetical protein